MPRRPTDPDVHVEAPTRGRVIGGVATSITAFIGTARRGPVDDPVTTKGWGDFERVFGGLWEASHLGYAVRQFLGNGGAEAVIVRVAGAGAAAARFEGGGFRFVAASPGSWANDHTLDVEPLPGTALFRVTVSDTHGVRERFLDVSTAEDDDRFLPRVLDRDGALVRVVETDGSFALPDGQPQATHLTAVAASGTDGGLPGVDAYLGSRAGRTGVFALEGVDLFTLLVIPPPARGATTAAAVYRAALAYCHGRRAVLLVDAGPDWTVAGAAAAKDALGFSPTDSGYGAVYFPWVQAADPERASRIDCFPPTGEVAGVIARTAAQHGVWKAPAGTHAHLDGLVGLTRTVTDDGNGELNAIGVNCLRTFAGSGPVVWGARTLGGADQEADAYRYLPVRRLALFIEESLRRGLGWVVSEPNDEPLWSQIRIDADAFMQGLHRDGALHGQTAAQAFFVECDAGTTTPDDIENGRLNIVVGFAPLKPAEFVILRIGLTAGPVEP